MSFNQIIRSHQEHVFSLVASTKVLQAFTRVLSFDFDDAGFFFPFALQNSSSEFSTEECGWERCLM